MSIKGKEVPCTEEFKLPNFVRFICGGLSGMGGILVTHPLDVLKITMQLSAQGTTKREFKNTIQVAHSIYEHNGISGLYSGISAALFRQATYTTTKLGIYSTLFDKLSKNGEPPPFHLKLLCGLTSGVVAAHIGSPADVALIRLASDKLLPPEARRSYTHIFNALVRIVNEEGVKALWTGIVPSVGRTMISNAVQLASYSEFKQLLLKTGYFEDNMLCYFCSSMISGFLTTVASLPPDIAKTRAQSMVEPANMKRKYKGMIVLLINVVRKEGLFALWKGFTPSYVSTAPQTVITFLIFEYLTSLYAKLFLESHKITHAV